MPEIQIAEYDGFRPGSVTVPVNSAVEFWLGYAAISHRVEFNELPVVSPILDPQSRWSIAFTRPGTYTYFDSMIPGHTGQIVVSAE